jgi:hypothetical protein
MKKIVLIGKAENKAIVLQLLKLSSNYSTQSME